MNEHTPTTDEIKASFVIGEHLTTLQPVTMVEAEFDRWLEQVKREAKAEALEEAAEQIRRMTLDDNPTDWLLDRAQQVRGTKPGQPDYAELFCRSMLSYSAEEYAPLEAGFEASQREDNQ